MPEFDRHYRTASAFSFGALLICALALGGVAGFLQLDRRIVLLVAVAFAISWTLLEARFIRKKPVDGREWQQRIDREYRLEIAGTLLSLYHQDILVSRFRWEGINEVQLHRCKEFPHLFWRVMAEHGEFLLPNGGRYAREFERDFIYRLPGYYEQRVMIAQSMEGFRSASSMWRRNDPYPKRNIDEDDGIWY